MTTPSNAPAPAQQGPRPAYKRSFKNYLIDSKFQLKYTGFILSVALAISAVMGGVLWRTSNQVVLESDKVVDESKHVVEESRKVSDLVRMSIKDDPVYSDNPELVASFNSASGDSEKQLAAQQAALMQQQEKTRSQQQTTLWVLVGGLSLLVILIGMLGIYFTHKVAGPIYKMRMLLTQVGEGKLNFYSRLRKGDELQEFFQSFATMVDRLRSRQSGHVDGLTAAIEAAKNAGATEEQLAKFASIRDEMRVAVDAKA